MTINRSQLACNLNDLINTDYRVGSTNPEDVLATSLSTCAQNQINTIIVDTVADLPDLLYYRSPSGMIYFIKDLEIHAVSSVDRWLTLDGRVLRTDTRTQIYAWGCNNGGRLGDNTTFDRFSPVEISGIFSCWCQASAGYGHSLGLRTNGTLWAWGRSFSGQLGDNTITTRSSPVSVVGGFSDWCQASAGDVHSLAVRSNGTLWSWGANGGRLGDNTVTTRLSPVSVVGGFSDWCQASAGGAHSLGLRSNGTLWAWGYNRYGKLGDNSVTDRSSPVSVVGGFTDWCQVSASYTHNLAVRSNGTLWAWGANYSGQLGDNSDICRSSPVSVVGGFTDWCQASAGYHSLAIRENGTLWAWGSNYAGSIGDETLTDRSSPVSVVGGFTDWCQTSARYYSLAVRSNGTVWAWGRNFSGSLGDGSDICRSSPVSVVGGFTDWCQVSAGSHSLGIRSIC
jgi:alpha-tubulin suppressor-like RCC1 family protein